MDNNNPNQLDKSLQKELARIQSDPYEDLAKQCNAEYELAWEHQKPKKEEALARLKLFNNQRRDKKAVGDTTMFTIFQTMLASLYVDRLNATWTGREEGDDDVAENLNALSKYDYTEMEKDITDYDWIWNTCFFGRAPLDLSEYIRDPENNIYLPIPRAIDLTVFLRDPRGTSINGNRMGRNSCRFFGEDLKMSREAIETNPHAVQSNIDFRSIKFGSGTKSLIEDSKAARDNAQGLQNDRNKGERALGVNAEYDITVWNTNWKVNGKVTKVKVWLANSRKLVIGFRPLKTDKWKVIDRPLYPTAGDWDGTSIPDLTEDKQRARAIAQNLGMKAMQADLYPMYIYDSNKIKNKNDLNFNLNKFIPADIPPGGAIGDALQPMRKAFPNLPLLNFIYESLDISAQKATATSDVQQGIQSQRDRPLGETNLIVSQSDTRYSLSAKIFGWSERAFWREWYNCYKENFDKDIDEKVIRLEGAFGPEWRKLTKDQINTKRLDPDVEIQSAYVSRAKQLEERQSLSTYFGLVLADPNANRRYAYKELGKAFGLTKDKIERLFPPTIDERIAEDENKQLNKNQMVKVKVEDDHMVHLEIHSKAAATPATYAHIETHKHALSIKKTNPELFPPDQNQLAAQATGQATGQTTPGTETIIAKSQPVATTLQIPYGGGKQAPAAKPIAPSQTSGSGHMATPGQ
jgi:hypothetical protein